MPRLILLCLCVWLSLCVLAAAHARAGLPASPQTLPDSSPALPDSPQAVPRPTRAPFAAPRPERVEQDGAVVLLLADRELPLVSGWLCFRGGALEDPTDRVGLAGMLAEALREGGSANEPGERLDEWLDARAASIEVHADRDSIRIGFDALSADLGGVLERIAGLLAAPAYPDDALARARARLESAIARRDDNAAGMADRALARVCYGPESPYAREPSLASAQAITRDDVLALHARVFARARLVLGLCGDFERAAALAATARLTAALPAGAPAPVAPPPHFDAPERSRLWLVDRPLVPQCELRLAAPGVSRRDARYPATYLWSHAIGLGMTSRMLARVRTELGLAYSVGAIFRADWSVPGRMYAWCGTRNEAAGQALVAMIEELQRALAEDLPAAELDAARERLLNAEIFRIDAPAKVLARAVDLELYGLPADFHERVLERVRELSAAEVRDAVASLVHPQELVAVAVGPRDSIRPALEPVLETLELARDVGARGDDAGARAVARMLDALGGAPAWRALARLECVETRVEGPDGALRLELSAATAGVSLCAIATRADGRRVETRVGAGGGTRESATGSEALDARAIAALVRDASRTPWMLAAHLARGEFAARAAGDARARGGEALEVWSDRERVARIELDARGTPLVYELERAGTIVRLRIAAWTERELAGAGRLVLPEAARIEQSGENVRWSGWRVHARAAGAAN